MLYIYVEHIRYLKHMHITHVLKADVHILLPVVMYPLRGVIQNYKGALKKNHVVQDAISYVLKDSYIMSYADT